MLVPTSHGSVRGTVVGEVARFLGIPYAAAPFGERRFAMPQPRAPWDGVLDATAFGPTPPQAPYGGGLESVLPTVTIEGEEILNLNIWAPTHAAAGRGHPVMVWLYGGGFSRGSTALATYDGTAFARDGVVLVSVNYRLGAEGFSVLDDAPLNLGIADQLAALRWVHENIAAFGGDPARVTVFGESAGGSSVATLLANPLAASLLCGAIIQSGPLTAASRTRAARVTRRMAKDLGIAPTRSAFAAIAPEDLVASQQRVTARSSPILGGPGFAVAIGDDLVPTDPGLALRAGAARDIPIMLGCTTEEYRLWFVPSGALDRITWWHVLAAAIALHVPLRAVRTIRRNHPNASAGEVLGRLATDLLLRVPMNQLADARGGRTWMYEFAWRTAIGDLGAAHALELGFVFDTLGTHEAHAFAGPDAPQPLADAMHAAWVRFATTGDPGWPEWNADRPVMTFDDPVSAVVHAPRDDERAALQRGSR